MNNLYRNKCVTLMEPWYPGANMNGVSVSVTDTLAGSPKDGDMIATNPKDPNDRWLVAAEYFADNYELAE